MNCTDKVVHEEVVQVVVDPEQGFKFERKACAKCHKWLGDKPITDS